MQDAARNVCHELTLDEREWQSISASVTAQSTPSVQSLDSVTHIVKEQSTEIESAVLSDESDLSLDLLSSILTKAKNGKRTKIVSAYLCATALQGGTTPRAISAMRH